MDNHVFAGVPGGMEPGGNRGETKRPRGWDLKGAMRYFSFKGNERYSRIDKRTASRPAGPEKIGASNNPLASSLPYLRPGQGKRVS